MLVGALQSHETATVRFVTIVGNDLFKNEIPIDSGFDAFPNDKHPDHIPLSSFHECVSFCLFRSDPASPS